jgi:hypothetical protein
MYVSNKIYITEGINKYELYCKQCVNDAKQHIINTNVLIQTKGQRDMRRSSSRWNL